VREGCRRPHG
jgi:sulfur-carrier protein